MPNRHQPRGDLHVCARSSGPLPRGEQNRRAPSPIPYSILRLRSSKTSFLARSLPSANDFGCLQSGDGSDVARGATPTGRARADVIPVRTAQQVTLEETQPPAVGRYFLQSDENCRLPAALPRVLREQMIRIPSVTFLNEATAGQFGGRLTTSQQFRRKRGPDTCKWKVIATRVSS